MSPTRTVLVIADRELRQRLRSKLFVGSTLALAVLLAVLAALPALIGVFGPDEPDVEAAPRAFALASVGPLDDAETTALEGAFGPLDVRVVDDEDEVAALLDDDEVPFGVVPGERIITTMPSGVFVVEGGASTRAAEALGLLSVLDGDADQVVEVLDVEPLPIERIGEADAIERSGRLLAANIGVVFLFGVLILYASMIINGVIEEKGSRVVELLVEAVPVRQLMSGKILGLGLIGLGQTLVLFGPAVTILLVTSPQLAPPGVGGLLGALVLWFILGYGLYAVMAAGLGSLVSRPEEAQAVLTPANTLMIVGYFIGFAAINAPDALFARVAALVPFTAPYAMLVRQAIGDPAWWEVVTSIGLMVLTIIGMTLLAARLYEGGILRVGARVRLRDAWRSARQ
jgi:ABC-2 type transport system permease protein